MFKEYLGEVINLGDIQRIGKLRDFLFSTYFYVYLKDNTKIKLSDFLYRYVVYERERLIKDFIKIQERNKI